MFKMLEYVTLLPHFPNLKFALLHNNNSLNDPTIIYSLSPTCSAKSLTRAILSKGIKN